MKDVHVWAAIMMSHISMKLGRLGGKLNKEISSLLLKKLLLFKKLILRIMIINNRIRTLLL